jgi:hypothetical protein
MRARKTSMNAVSSPGHPAVRQAAAAAAAHSVAIAAR